MRKFKYFSTFIINFFYTCGSFLYNPFENYRQAAKHKNPFIALPIWVLIFVYFTLSSFIYRKSSFLALILFSFFIIIFLIISFFSRKKISFHELFNVWSFSYLPTLFWFVVTFILFFIFPPPHQHIFFGFSFSIFYLLFSLFCLYLKIICLFIVLKYVIKLSLIKTIVLMFLIWGIVVVFGIFLYKLHFFRIPFI